MREYFPVPVTPNVPLLFRSLPGTWLPAPTRILISAALLLSTRSTAQAYNVMLIPDSLKKHARAIIRDEEMVVEIKSPSKAITREHHAYTILNEDADNIGGFSSWYSKFTSINSITGTLYDAMGKELKRVKKKDMEDRSATSENNLIDDARYKAHSFYYRSYPYTVDYQEEDEMNGILYFPSWRPLYSSGISTQHSRYVIIAPKDYPVRYKPVNCAYEPIVTESGGKKIYTWEAYNLPARQTESSGPRWSEMAPAVLVAPSEFEAQGYRGDMSTWEGYGKFIYQLLAGRDALPEDIKKQVHALTDHLNDPREKVYALYDFLQKNTHYISIQLGIGGWQPFPADYVAMKRYGDCKALSNYMIALLKEAGIRGRYVEIRAGRDAAPMIEDFPSFQSNHVISCVPLEKDTIWLECTSQSESPGFMGSFTGGRKAILIDENGGHIVHTPSYTNADNLRCRVAEAIINGDGDLDANVNTRYRAIREEMPHALMLEVSAEYREKYLNSLFNLPTYKVEKSHYEEQRGAIPEVKEYLHVVSPNYAGVSGKRLFLTPNLFDKSQTRLPADSIRRYDFITDLNYSDIDSITIRIPDGYKPESVPQAEHIDSRFGKYEASVQISQDRIVYYRRQERMAGRYPPTDYKELVKYYEQVYQADHRQVVLVKQ